MTIANASTPFPLGAYLGNPNNSNAADQVQFDTNYTTVTALEDIAPQYFDIFLDQSQPISNWVGNAQWNASSSAASVNASSMTPVIAVPFSSTAAGALAPQQSFEAFASGQYDSVLQGIVATWVKAGFTDLYFRPGWEMNLPGTNYAGDSAQSQSDWVAAFQHISTVLRQAATADGATATIVWNPSATNYSNAEATTNLYPGNAYVDVIGADAYANIYPYSDGGPTAAYHDWDTGAEDITTAQFIADPVNREHYWSYPAATKWSLDGSGGHSQSLTSLIQFAEAQGKPFAIPEAGAGNSDDGQDVNDDAAYPQWLAQQLTAAQAAGEPISFVNLWDNNGGGNYHFSNASDNKPAEAAAWAKYFGAATATSGSAAATSGGSVTLGSGADTLSFSVAEDAWQGNALFTLSVDGVQIGGTQTATASDAAGQTQTFKVMANLAAGSHTVSVNFLNDAYGGSAAADRNLYVQSTTFDGVNVAGGTLAMLSGGVQSFTAYSTAPSPTVTLGSGPDTLALAVAEDAWQGDAQFTVSVDGVQIGGTQSATASHAAGQTQTFDVLGSFGPGSHAVSVNFLNDAYGGNASADRNLYVQSTTLDGVTMAGGALNLLAGGAQGFTAFNATQAPPDTLDLHVSEDAWQGDAQFTISINGTTVGGIYTATASHVAGATQDVTVSGNWGQGTPTIGITFINDAWGGTASTDRNLYVDGMSYDGQASSGAPAPLKGNGTVTFTQPSGSTPITLHMSEDAWAGDAQYSVNIDGKTVVADGSVSALHSQNASQAVDLQDLLSPGTHDLAVSFLNDAWGGTAAMDRNLYLTGIDVNGKATGNTAALMSTGTQHFQIVVPAHA